MSYLDRYYAAAPATNTPSSARLEGEGTVALLQRATSEAARVSIAPRIPATAMRVMADPVMVYIKTRRHSMRIALQITRVPHEVRSWQ
jgi:hypothetical protein